MSHSPEDTLGARVAGGLLVGGAVLTLDTVLAGRDIGVLVRWVALADLAIGASLVAGRGWRLLAIIRCMLAAVVLTGLTVDGNGLSVVDGDWLDAGTQLGFSVGLIALLVGDPSPARIVAGVVAAAPRIGVTLSWLVLRKAMP